jgi:hypothetical protein
MLLGRVLPLLAAVLLRRAAEAVRDGVYDDIKLTRLAFGSCNKQVSAQSAKYRL